jgi:hypothetical protein
MPALRLFGRRWLLAPDDVPLPASFLALFHLVSTNACASHQNTLLAPLTSLAFSTPTFCILQVWVALLIALLASLDGPANCRGASPYYVAIAGLLGAFSASLLLEVAAVVVGMRGSLFDTRRRAAIPKLVYLDMLSFMAQGAFNGEQGTRGLTQASNACMQGCLIRRGTIKVEVVPEPLGNA